MKQFILVLALLLSAVSMNSQTYKIVGDSLVQVEKQTVKTKDVKTTLTVVKSKVTYPVWKSVRGKYYIIRTSKNTGKEYKQYLKLEE
jgi:hypothetical protein